MDECKPLDKGGMKLWSRPVEDNLGLMTRAEVDLPADAKELFKLMTSKAGFEIIDPGYGGANIDHNPPPIERLEWSGHRVAECVLASSPSKLFPISDREFVVCNLFDQQPTGVGQCRLTVSKPVLKAPMVSALETKL